MSFIGDIVTRWEKKGRMMLLVEDFAFEDSTGRRWEAPAGTLTDGASIPRMLWTFEGGPFEGTWRRAAVLHDAACAARTPPSSQAAAGMFREAMIADGVDADTALRFYVAVRLFGPQWPAPRAPILSFDSPFTRRPISQYEAVKAALDAAGL